MSGFLSPRALLAGGPRGLTLATERALWHLGFTDVRIIDGAGDEGADILAVRDREQWVLQCKFSSRGAVDRTGVDDAERARSRYGADHAVVVTNTSLNATAEARRKALGGIGIKVDAWAGPTLEAIYARMPARVPSNVRAASLPARSGPADRRGSRGLEPRPARTGDGTRKDGGRWRGHTPSP